MNLDNKIQISNFRNILINIFPIYKQEFARFFSIALLMFCILCVQNLIRALKDSIVTTMIGAETISFLKFWGVMPSAFIITIIYVKLINSIKSEYIFYIVISVFLTFFIIFAFYIFPNHELLHLNQDTANILVSRYPNFKWFILLLSNWSFSLFYVIAELWPNIVFALLFWQFVNIITTVEESKRFYPLFGLIGQTGLVFSGIFLHNIHFINDYIVNFIGDINLQNNSIISVQVILSTVSIFCIAAIVLFYFINHKILDQKQASLLHFDVNKKTLGLIDSIKMILSSKYIMLIALMLICYGVAINLVEGPWKSIVSKVYKTPTEYARFVGSYISYVGVFTLIFTLIGSNIVRYLGWFVAAIITPIMLFVTGVLFFMFINFDIINSISAIIFILTDPIMIAVVIGAIQNVLSKSTKYTLFDSTKEMSYVPLPNELKTKGKAAADVIGTKLGKSFGALIQSSMFIMMPTATYSSITTVLMIVFCIVCFIWIIGVKELNKEYVNAILHNSQNN